MPKLAKALADLTPADLQAVVDGEWIEDEVLEFKQTLSQQDGGKPDKWLIDQSEVGKQAKRKLLAEVVAMANSYGGDVILGIEQATENPPKAVRLNAIPKCIDLASRLEHAARDLIKPQIPMLGVRGIPIDGEAGVVVFRVPRSRLAPHRLEMADFVKECYRRVGERTEAMTMREIQDLTFSVSRGLQHVEERLRELQTEFNVRMDMNPTLPLRRGYSVSAVPLSNDIFIEKVHGNASVTPESRSYQVRLRPNGRPITFDPLRHPPYWRPILRGTECAVELGEQRAWIQRLTCDGVVFNMNRLQSASGEDARGGHVLHSAWLFASVLNCFETIDKFRAAAGAHATQYAVEVNIANNVPLPILAIDSEYSETGGTFTKPLTTLPQYQVGERDSWFDTMRLMWTDFWNAAGHSPSEEALYVEGWG
jgi:hypothetical protein